MDQGARLRRRIREELGRRQGSFNKGECVKKLSCFFGFQVRKLRRWFWLTDSLFHYR
jgi:hypothetical protein